MCVHLPLGQNILCCILILLVIFIVALRFLQIVSVDLFQLQLNLLNVGDPPNHIHILLVVPTRQVCTLCYTNTGGKPGHRVEESGVEGPVVLPQ